MEMSPQSDDKIDENFKTTEIKGSITNDAPMTNEKHVDIPDDDNYSSEKGSEMAQDLH